ncbi:hypothetical protein DL96DRAFT_1594464 [Flagelloscypha sp. PMI_526]|nr:hypothetical protein DL96DRAFT_1594464 [Flagelloscypha sp. PMI_526]
MSKTRWVKPELPNRRKTLSLTLVATVLSFYLLQQLSIHSAFHTSQHDELIDGDETWPIRHQELPYDISTDYPYPRHLEYDVEEGTWLHLTVHPITSDIVFAMVGDLYCLPGNETASNSKIMARPVMLGIPHDTDPTFDATGERLAFRSDAETGVDNIFVVNWGGCDAMDLRAPSGSPQFLNAQKYRHLDEELLAQGYPETAERKVRRLTREGRVNVRRVTNETYRWVTSPRFHPTNASRMIAIRWMTPQYSDIGAPEGWAYDIPRLDEPQPRIPQRGGIRVVGRTLPLGYGPDRYHEIHIGPEQFIWYGDDALIYAKNVQEDFWHYGKDIHKGIYAIKMFNLSDETTETLVEALPGGASRPELSRDQRTLAFVRRVRDKEMLVLRDMLTGTFHYIWDGLTYDLSDIHAPFSTYPSFSFSPSDDAIIIWAAGRIWRVPLSVNSHGERVRGGSPRQILFHARIEKRLADTLHTSVNLTSLESQDLQRVRALKELRSNDDGTKVVFQAAGLTVAQEVGNSATAVEVPVLCSVPTCAYHHPSFVPGHSNLIIHTRWSNQHFSTFELADLLTGRIVSIEGTPLGKYLAPAISAGIAPRRLAFVKTAEDVLTSDAIATSKPGIYICDLVNFPSTPRVENLRFIPSTIDLSVFPANHIRMTFIDEDTALHVEQNTQVFKVDLNGNQVRTLARGKMSMEVALSKKTAAFVDYFNVYVAPVTDELLWSRPENATRGLMRLSLHGGHDITFSGDGKRLFWLFGAELHFLELKQISGSCKRAIIEDRQTFGVDCIDTLVHRQEIFVSHISDIARLKNEAFETWHTDTLVITNATILSMETGNLEKDLIRSGRLLIRNGIIEDIGSEASVNIPKGAEIVDVEGGFVVPGFIDVHAHWFGCFFSRYPSSSWELAAFLAYGVTTLHNPSAHNVEAFAERSRVERGITPGPRIFSVGNIIYGSAQDIHQDIVDERTAYSALARIKAEGQEYGLTYKNYGISSRAARQRLLRAARNLSMLAVPEAGMNFDWDLTYIIDGMTTVEHALPIPVLYDDVTILFAKSGTGITPTHLVNYGGGFGEEVVWKEEAVNFNDKLRRFIPHSTLEKFTESASRPPDSYSYRNTSESIARMSKLGLSSHVGAHGEQPFGLNYHREMSFIAEGGLSNFEVLLSATRKAAKTLGLLTSIGSLGPGKLADLLVYPPGVDLLDGRIDQKTRQLKYVMRGGRMWLADTLEELWPVHGRRLDLPPLNPSSSKIFEERDEL